MIKFKPYRIFTATHDTLVQRMFAKRGHELATRLDQADILVFTGGADILPVLYGERSIFPKAKFNLSRDLHEVKLYRKVPRALPKVGICRGAQLLNVLCGGSLWQDVNNHQRSHDVYDMRLKQNIRVTSIHHQMMRPPSHARVIAVAGEATQKQCEHKTLVVPLIDGCNKPATMEDPEVVFFKDEKALCFQPHPEYAEEGSHCTDYFFDLLDQYIFNRVQYPSKSI